jgi:hypothetical protein
MTCVLARCFREDWFPSLESDDISHIESFVCSCPLESLSEEVVPSLPNSSSEDESSSNGFLSFRIREIAGVMDQPYSLAKLKLDKAYHFLSICWS